ncbi:MAG: signal peptidase II, partial [Oscillospiraceae bacterium]|nr:signal peptidase II [Oscillospiraceae bacterium]
MLYAIVALLVIILDQWTKFWVAGHIALNTGSRDLIPGLLKIVNIHNDGAALGFLSGKNAGMLFIVLCAVFTIFVIVALATKLIKSSVGRWSLLFIMAGGLSNCIDRLLSGYVQDMFLPTFMDNLPIFNVADIFITVFCLVFILFVLFGGKSDEEDADDDEEEYEDDEDAGDDDLDEDEEEKPSRTHIKSVFKPRKVEDEDE